MKDLSLHILDLVENAIAAKAKKIEILIQEVPREDRLLIEIKDDGIGFQHSSFLRVEQHSAGEPILDAAAGIQELALGMDGDALRLEMKRDEWRVANEREDGIAPVGGWWIRWGHGSRCG